MQYQVEMVGTVIVDAENAAEAEDAAIDVIEVSDLVVEKVSEVKSNGG